MLPFIPISYYFNCYYIPAQNIYEWSQKPFGSRESAMKHAAKVKKYVDIRHVCIVRCQYKDPYLRIGPQRTKYEWGMI